MNRYLIISVDTANQILAVRKAPLNAMFYFSLVIEARTQNKHIPLLGSLYGVYTVHSDGPKFRHVKGHQAQIEVQPLTNRLLRPAPKTQKKILMFFEVINCIHEKGWREKLYRIIISQYRLEGKKKKNT